MSFCFDRRPEAALLADLDEVVEEADEAEPSGEEEHEQPARGRRVEREAGGRGSRRPSIAARMMAPPIVGVPRFVWCEVGPVVADELAVAALDEELDEQRRAEQRDEQRERRCQQDALHRAAASPVVAATGVDARSPPSDASRSPSQRSPLSRLDLSRTTSPGAQPRGEQVVGRIGVGHPLRAGERVGERPGALADGHDVVEAERRGIRPDGRVLGVAVGAELEHGAEDRPALPRHVHRGDGVERRTHGVGVRVVGVVDDDHPVGAVGDLHAPAAHRLGRLQTRDHLVERQPELERGRRDGERVADLVGTALLQRDSAPSLAGTRGCMPPCRARRGRRPRHARPPRGRARRAAPWRRDPGPWRRRRGRRR